MRGVVRLLGLGPSVVLLLIYGAVSFEAMWSLSFEQIWPYLSLSPHIGFDSTKYKFTVFLLCTVGFPVVTPLYLLPWSHFLPKVTGASESAMPWRRRILRTLAATMKMSLANYVIGGIGLFASIALYIWQHGVPIPIVR